MRSCLEHSTSMKTPCSYGLARTSLTSKQTQVKVYGLSLKFTLKSERGNFKECTHSSLPFSSARQTMQSFWLSTYRSSCSLSRPLKSSTIKLGHSGLTPTFKLQPATRNLEIHLGTHYSGYSSQCTFGTGGSCNRQQSVFPLTILKLEQQSKFNPNKSHLLSRSSASSSSPSDTWPWASQGSCSEHTAPTRSSMVS